MATRRSWSGRNGACPWTCSPPTGPECRYMSKILATTSPGVSAETTSRRGGTSSTLPIKTWRPTSARHQRRQSRLGQCSGMSPERTQLREAHAAQFELRDPQQTRARVLGREIHPDVEPPSIDRHPPQALLHVRRWLRLPGVIYAKRPQAKRPSSRRIHARWPAASDRARPDQDRAWAKTAKAGSRGVRLQRREIGFRDRERPHLRRDPDRPKWVLRVQVAGRAGSDGQPHV